MQEPKVAIKSNIGGRGQNQDYAESLPTRFGLLTVVCDGMGGANGGEVASSMTTDIVFKEIAINNITNPAEALASAIQVANENVYRESQTEEHLSGMGTTITAVLLTSPKAILAHVGDSRVYHVRSGKVIHRTWDHSKVFEWVKEGRMTEEEAKSHPDSNMITRAIGIAETVEIEITERDYKDGDRFILTTDGITDQIYDEELIKLATQNKSLQTLADSVVNHVNEKAFSGEDKGGHDNLTIAIVDIAEVTVAKAAINKRSKYSLVPYLVILGLIGAIVLNELFRVSAKNDKIELLTTNKKKTLDSLHREHEDYKLTVNKSKDELIDKLKAEFEGKLIDTLYAKKNEIDVLETDFSYIITCLQEKIEGKEEVSNFTDILIECQDELNKK